MSVGRIATRVTAIGAPGESVLEVARRMETANVGCVVIVEDGVPQGIITDRVTFRQGAVTIYTRFGDWVLFASLVAAAAAILSPGEGRPTRTERQFE